MQATNHFESIRPAVKRERQERGWGSAVLAGLPHLLMGLLIGWDDFFPQNDIQTLRVVSTALGLLLAGLFVYVLTRAARNGWPLWSASWYGYLAWVVLALIGGLLNLIQSERIWVFNLAMLLGWLGAIVIGYLYLFASDRLRALLAILFLFPIMGLLSIEFIPNLIEGALAIGTWGLAAVTAALILRSGDYRRGLLYSLLLVVVLSLAISYVAVYQASGLPEFIPFNPRFSDFVSTLTMFLAIGAALFGLPPLVQWIWGFVPKKTQSS
jgi:hypothetical protein